MKKKLPVSLVQPFNFEECLRFLNRSPQECLHSLGASYVRKWIRVNGETCLFDLSQPEDHQLMLQIHIGNAGMEAALMNYVHEWCDLDRNLSPFLKIAKTDPLLGPLSREYKNLKVIGIPDLFEALCWSVIGQQINLNFAYALKKRMVEQWGKAFTFEGTHYYHFPEPDIIASLEPADFQPFQFSVRKAEYIIGIARLMTEGKLAKDTLRAQSSEEIIAQLIAIRGIGNWSAQYVLMKCFQRPEAFPLQDAGLHNAIKRLQGQEKKPSLEEIVKLAKPWKGWEGYATFYLWQSLLTEK